MHQPALAAKNTLLQARTEFQVQQQPRLDGTDVRIVTDAGNVVVTGHVTLLPQKLLYEQIAWQTPGTVDVGSDSPVVPGTRVSDRGLENAIVALARQTAALTLPADAPSLSATTRQRSPLFGRKRGCRVHQYERTSSAKSVTFATNWDAVTGLKQRRNSGAGCDKRSRKYHSHKAITDI